MVNISNINMYIFRKAKLTQVLNIFVIYSKNVIIRSVNTAFHLYCVVYDELIHAI